MATRFKDFMREIEEEARAEGPDAVAELEALRTHFRLGRQLAAARRAQRLSQAEVAARAGIDQADVSDLERGAANPTLNKLEAVATAIGMRLDLTKARAVRRKSPPVTPRRSAARTR
ncbi:MAG TPA: helix-turn-helix transcriptional regulator [Myxococcales bacterium]|nr:helix-turn-helix transcriptional regulator [Myxococcales bacterium]